MKKMLLWSVPIKSFAAMFFTGIIILYMITGSAYSLFTDESLEYSISFMFAIQSMVLSVIISVLWNIFFSEAIIKKMRYFKRLIIFSFTLIPVFAVCLWVFYSVFADWTFLWLIIAGMLVVGLIIISLLFESYFKLIGRRYTEMLEVYKTKTSP